MLDTSGFEKAIFIFKPLDYGRLIGNTVMDAVSPAGDWLTSASGAWSDAKKVTIGDWSPAQTIANSVKAAIDTFAGIPFILDEQTFKIIVHYPSKKALSIYEERKDTAGNVWRYAKTIQNDVSIEIQCKKDNIFMTSLSMFIDTLIKKLSALNADENANQLTVNFFYQNIALKNVIITGYETRPTPNTASDVTHIITISDNIKPDAAKDEQKAQRVDGTEIPVPKDIV